MQPTDRLQMGAAENEETPAGDVFEGMPGDDPWSCP